MLRGIGRGAADEGVAPLPRLPAAGAASPTNAADAPERSRDRSGGGEPGEACRSAELGCGPLAAPLPAAATAASSEWVVPFTSLPGAASLALPLLGVVPLSAGPSAVGCVTAPLPGLAWWLLGTERPALSAAPPPSPVSASTMTVLCVSGACSDDPGVGTGWTTSADPASASGTPLLRRPDDRLPLLPSLRRERSSRRRERDRRDSLGGTIDTLACVAAPAPAGTEAAPKPPLEPRLCTERGTDIWYAVSCTAASASCTCRNGGRSAGSALQHRLASVAGSAGHGCMAHG